MERKGILLYLNIPFCPKHCGCCGRYQADARSSAAKRYLPALERELQSAAAELEDHQVKAVWVGGGIAGHIFDEELGHLLHRLPEWFSVEEEAEITLKVHPGMVSAETLKACQRGHVTRVSIEYGTAVTAEYEALGRFLDTKAMDVTQMVLSADSTLKRSFDVLVGIPGQTERSMVYTLRQVLAYGAGHVSLFPYEALPENGEYKQSAACREIRSSLWKAAGHFLAEQGFAQYLPGQFALPGQECRYRRFEAGGMECWGFGPGAVSCLDGMRSVNTGSLEEYIRYADDPAKLVVQFGSMEDVLKFS